MAGPGPIQRHLDSQSDSLATALGCRARQLGRMRLACGESQVQSSGSATFVRGDWSRNNFYRHSLPIAGSSGAVVRYWRKDEHLVLINSLGSLPRNSVVRLTDRLDMTIVVYWDVKPKIKLTNISKRPKKKSNLLTNTLYI